MHQKQLDPGVGTGARKIASAESRCDLPKTPDAASPTKKKSPDATVGAVIAPLAERWPAAFAVHEGRRRPLKVGIFKDIFVSELGGAVTRAELSRALACYTKNLAYMSKLRADAVRVGLDGEAAGIVTVKEADHAKMLRSMAASRREGGP